MNCSSQAFSLRDRVCLWLRSRRNAHSAIATLVVGLSFGIGVHAHAQSLVYAWGSNSNGQIGDGTTVNKLSPIQVHGAGNVGILSNVTSVSGGDTFSMALQTDGTVLAWGNNFAGQVGDGTSTQRHVPVQVHGEGNNGSLSGITAISSGLYHSLSLGPNGSVYSWGQGFHGAVGDGTTTDRSAPVAVHGVGNVGTLTGMTAVVGGGFHSLALGPGGTVFAWGQGGNGQVGNGSFLNRTSPVQVHGPNNVGVLTGITSLAAGGSHTLAIGAGGTVWAWGTGGNGQLGENDAINRPFPVQVRGAGNVGNLTEITAVSCGNQHSLALDFNGTVYAWGNDFAVPGGMSLVPVVISSLSGHNIVDVQAIGLSSYALSADGRLWAWGYNGFGQLGLGDTLNRFAPTEVFAPAGYRFDSIKNVGHGGHVLAVLSPIPSPGAITAFAVTGLVAARRRRARH